MEPFETFEHAGCVIELHYDDDPQSPSEWDTLGTLYDFTCDYRGMESPHGQAREAMERSGVALLVRYLRMVYGVHAIPYDIYDHGQVTIREASLLEKTCSGYIAADAASIEMTGVALEDVAEGLRSELHTWQAYFEGSVCGYVVKCEDIVIDSCWGFYPDKATREDPFGLEYVRSEAREVAEDEQRSRLDAQTKGIPTTGKGG